MKTTWDYTALAQAYLKRPDYSNAAIDAMLAIAGISKDSKCCDIGAGTAHLTLLLAEKGLQVRAIEPNDAMRERGLMRTQHLQHVQWHEATGEQTGQKENTFDLVSFGSSFNVCDRQTALHETARILKPKGWFACMWNHRYLADPIQAQIESIIKEYVSDYNYGTRREDQTGTIDASQLFGPVVHLNSRIIHEQTISQCVEAWKSHATLARQSQEQFTNVVEAIEQYLNTLNTDIMQIPYVTNIWMAQLR